MFDNLDILRNIDKFTGQITRVRRFKRGICKTLTRTVGGNEVLDDIQTLFKVRGNRCFDNLSTWFCHKATHTCKLTDLSRRTPCTRVCHHIDRVKSVFIGLHKLHHLSGNRVVCICPDIDDLVITLLLCKKTRFKLLLDLDDFRF